LLAQGIPFIYGREGVNTVSISSQNARYKQFGPLFDGKKITYAGLINQGWIYLFESRLPSEDQKFYGSDL
jgi:hypothetical protein